MPQITIDMEEWWPIYDLKRGLPVEITEEEKQRIEQCFKEFHEIQDILRDKYNDARENFYKELK